jgi:hypothetical protein
MNSAAGKASSREPIMPGPRTSWRRGRSVSRDTVRDALIRRFSIVRTITIHSICPGSWAYLSGRFVENTIMVIFDTPHYETKNEDWNNFIIWINSGGIDYPSLIAIATALVIILSPIIIFVSGFVLNLFNPIVLMITFRQKYPKWWFDFYVALIRFLSRVFTYGALLTDVYPSTDEEQNVHFDVQYPDAKKDLSQGLPLIKWFLAIPHFFVLCVLAVVAIACSIFTWFAILFTARVPKGTFEFIEGYFRWVLRVAGYAVFQFTDKYPPFSLE